MLFTDEFLLEEELDLVLLELLELDELLLFDLYVFLFDELELLVEVFFFVFTLLLVLVEFLLELLLELFKTDLILPFTVDDLLFE